MHAEARAFVEAQVAKLPPPKAVYEIGGRFVNGEVRSLFDGVTYTSIDLHPGPHVDVVGNAMTHRLDEPVDLVVCCEVLEHASEPWQILAAAKWALRPGGWLILTTACEPRAPHSGLDGGPPYKGEWYGNVEPELLKGWLRNWVDVSVECHRDRGDLYAIARRPTE